MKISKQVIVDITMTGQEHAELVSMLKHLRRLLGDPSTMADQAQQEQVDVMVDRLEAL